MPRCANIRKRFVDEFVALAIDRRVDSPDAFERKTRAATVFTNAANVAVALFGNQNEPAATAANADDAARLDHFLEPAMQRFRARLRPRLLQTRPCADQSFKTRHRG